MESLPVPIIIQTLCTRCGLCVEHCPTEALDREFASGYPVVIDPEACEYEGACETVCPTGAIELPFLIEFAPEPPLIKD
ncbi:MAG: 4Fe-4S binding protein [Ardenticatenaceae bacterium]|nr:4Fe-4S binding protein [Ardenticatenaceae bacterium]HBY96928.1 4Fe-4S ferredoxin [Chloroflexota bacterium]